MSRPNHPSRLLVCVLGVATAVSLLAYVATATKSLMLLSSLGATALLLVSAPEAPLSHPRTVFLGHVSASLIALGCFWLFGPHWWTVGIATGLGVGFMMLARCVHPPAGSNAILVFLAKPGGWFFLSSTVAGAAALIAFAFVYHRATGKHRYPLTWRLAETA